MVAKALRIVDIVLVIVGIGAGCVAIAGFSQDADIMKNTYWSKLSAHFDDFEGTGYALEYDAWVNLWGLTFEYGGEVFEELEKMYKLTVDVSNIQGRPMEKPVDGQVKVTEGIEINAQGEKFTTVWTRPKGDANARMSLNVRPEQERVQVNTVPRMNRLELRDYAASTEFVESDDFKKPVKYQSKYQ